MSVSLVGVCLCGLSSTRTYSKVFYCIIFEIVHERTDIIFSVTSAVDCKV